MTIRFTAVVEHGLLRPVEPVVFAEGTTLEVIVVPPSTAPAGRSAAEIMAQIAALPMEPTDCEFSGRDHDKILYGDRGAPMIFVDSGAWYAGLIPTDPDHAAAQAWLAQNTERLFTTDYVVDETLTLLRARGQQTRAFELGSAFVAETVAALHFVTAQEFHAAWDIFQRFSDKEWSFTDCASKAIIESLGIATAFSFDQHFRQFGTVRVVP